MQGSEKIVRSFLDGWKGSAVRELYEAHLDDDCTWLNTGFRARQGKDDCMKLVDKMLEVMPRVEVELLHITENENVVFLERRDHCFDTQGNKALVAEVAGILELRAGKIIYWHEYFDPRPWYSYPEPWVRPRNDPR